MTINYSHIFFRRFLKTIIISLILLSSRLSAGQLADRVFAYQQWKTLQADCQTEQIGNSLMATSSHWYRSKLGDAAIRFSQGYDLFHNGLYYSKAGKYFGAYGTNARQVAAFLLARFFCLGAELKALAVIDKEEGEQLWIHFSDLNPAQQLKISAGSSGKISRMECGFAAVEDTAYTALPQGLALSSWTLRYLSKIPESPVLNSEPMPDLRVRFRLENIVLDADFPEGIFEAD